MLSSSKSDEIHPLPARFGCSKFYHQNISKSCIARQAIYRQELSQKRNILSLSNPENFIKMASIRSCMVVQQQPAFTVASWSRILKIMPWASQILQRIRLLYI
jgi:hypothetical protein